eukprot:9388571-Karenia_brevis.AAC.1
MEMLSVAYPPLMGPMRVARIRPLKTRLGWGQCEMRVLRIRPLKTRLGWDQCDLRHRNLVTPD